MRLVLDLGLLCCLVAVSVLGQGSDPEEILGCGGFATSQYKLDFDKIEIKLYSKQGRRLIMKTECAPSTGYYFLPLEGTGEYVLKISPPTGWTFNPPEYSVSVDGKTDECSMGKDINFDFNGFSVDGKVVTRSSSEGPAEVTLTLTGQKGFSLTTKSTTGGSFVFDSIPPGTYDLKASHPGLTLEKDSYSFTLTNENIHVENKIIVSGYEVSGKVSSEQTPVEGVTLVLLGSVAVPGIKNCQPGKPEGFSVPANAPALTLCHQSSDKTGTFRFSNLTPGKYSIIPVYKGKNIVYNVNPDRLDMEVKHAPLQLVNGFEVEGFTVLGKVKGLSGATILVNGEVKATSGHDGSFSIPKMKPGTYEFEITAEKFQFDKQQVKVTASNPVLPEFVPARFLTCGQIQLAAGQTQSTQLTLNFESLSSKPGENPHRAKVADPARVCIFLPNGKYSVKVESVPEKIFTPESLALEVPSGSDFTFREFTGFISGRINCAFTKDSKCDGTVELKTKSGEQLSSQQTQNGIFKFPNLGSGHYVLQIVLPTYCWKSNTLNVLLKTANVDNLEFVTSGYSLTLSSSHETKVKVYTPKNKLIEEFGLKSSEPRTMCLKEPADSYRLEPSSCHTFEKDLYTFKPGKEAQAPIEMIAKLHEHSGTIETNAPVTDLQVKRNGEVLDAASIAVKEVKGKFIYEIKAMEGPGKTTNLQFFSYGFIFEPNTASYETGSDCQDNLFQVLGQKSHVIKGSLRPALEGVEIEIVLLGDPDSTTYVSSDAAGNYIAGPFIHNHGFQVQPKMTGYSFRPLEKDPYSFQVLQWAKIHVNVQNAVSKTSVSNVLLSLSGPNAYRQNRMTNAEGELTFDDLQPGQYYLKALLKEFSFEPSALNIDLQEQETKKVTLSARRESFSLYGQLSSLSGDLMPNLVVAAKGQGNCSEYAEDGVSDEVGNFRIWSLKSYCNYEVSVVKKDDLAQKVERTIPETLHVTMGNEDIQNTSFVIIAPVKRMDVTLRCNTNNPKNLDTLKAVIHSAKNRETPLQVVPFNGVPYIILPPIPKDMSDYFITFESTLSRTHFEYTLPSEISFTANKAYAHHSFDFDVETVHVDQEIGKNSYIAFAFIIFVFLVIINFERISGYLKEALDNYLHSSGGLGSAAKRSKLKVK